MKKIPLVGKILIGFVLGTGVGLFLAEGPVAPETAKKVISFVAPFGNVLVAMLKMVVYPIILFSLILGAASLPLKKSGRVGGSVFLLFMVLENMGLPAEQVTMIVALCLGINPILDMFETCCNVTGDNVCTYIVAKKSGLVSSSGK